MIPAGVTERDVEDAHRQRDRFGVDPVITLRLRAAYYRLTRDRDLTPEAFAEHEEALRVHDEHLERSEQWQRALADNAKDRAGRQLDLLGKVQP